MPTRKYNIQFLIQDQAAQAAIKRSIAGLGDIEKAATRASAALDKVWAKTASGAASAATAMKGAAQSIGDVATAAAAKHAKAAQQIDVGLHKLQVSGIKFNDSLVKGAEKRTSQLQAIEDRYTRRDYDRRVKYEARVIRQKEREAKQLQAIEDRYLRDEYRRRVAFQAHQEQEAEAAAERRAQAVHRGVVAATGAALTGIKVLGDAYRKIREDSERAAEATLVLRKGLRVESVLKGEPQTTNKTLLESLQFRMETGLGEGGASDFTREFLGSIPIAEQKKNITPAVKAGLMVAAGRMAARQGGDAGTRGDLAGILGQFHRIGSVQQGLGELEGIRIALTEGRGDDTPLTRQLLKAAGSIVKEGGSVGSLTEMAALIGVTSLAAGPEEAGTRAEQVNRFFRAGLAKHGMGRGAEEPAADYLKGLGITEKTTLEEGMDKLHADLQKARAAGRDPEIYLAEHGVREYEVRRAVIETESNYDAFKQRMRAARGANANMGADVEKANQAFRESPEGRQAFAEAALKGAEVRRGLLNERMATYLKEAEASPEWQEREKSVVSTIGDMATGFLTGNFLNATTEGRNLNLRITAQKIQRRRALAAGVTEAELSAATSRALSRGLGDASAEQFNEIDQLILSRGGSTAVNIVPVMEGLKQAIEENNRILKGRAPAAPQPLPAAPRAGALRP
jgi:hypothetical protein